MREKLISLALDAGAMMMDNRGVSVAEKSSARDLVTTRDTEIQNMMVDACRRLALGCSFICEENHLQTGAIAKGPCFIIDPIDGTANYVHGLNHSCTSIAYLEDGQVQSGVIYDPFKNEMFSAELGKGAFLNGSPLTIADTSLADGITCFGTAPYDDSSTKETFQMANLLYDNSLDVRRSGSAALDCCYVACHRFSLYFEMQISPWDHAAGSFIVKEAGGIAVDIKGKPLQLSAPTSILCGVPTAIEDFLNLK